MSRNESLERQVESWLAEESPTHIPDRVLRTLFERTRATRQDRMGFGWRPIQMSRNLSMVAAGAVAIVIAVAGVSLLGRSSAPAAVSSAPSPDSAAPSTSANPTAGSSLAVISGLPGRFAFAANRTGDFEIYSMKPDRSELVRLTDDAANDREPAWSPDGTKIAFARSNGANAWIWTMNADGSRATRLVEGGTPQWAPDSRRIVAQAGGTIFVVNADGSNQVTVIDEPTVGMLINGPSWSVDGTRILFVGSTGEGRSDVYSVALDGTDQRRLTSTRNEEASPRMSPDGRRIAYQTQDTCVCVMNADGTSPTSVASWSGKGAWISWSPDGRWIVTAGGGHGPLYLHVIAADGSDDRIASDTSDYADVSWGP